jgi:hypothetical protein
MFGGKVKNGLIYLTKKKSYYRIREKKDKIVQRLCAPLLHIGIQADVVTSTGFLTGVISISFLGSSHELFISFWGITRLLDIMDGAIYRYNKKKWYKKLNLDKYADIAYDTLLTLAAAPYTGLPLALSAIAARFIHVRLERKDWANNLLSPHGGFTQAFFLFRMFKEGMIIQTLYSLCTPLAKRMFHLRTT